MGHGHDGHTKNNEERVPKDAKKASRGVPKAVSFKLTVTEMVNN